MTSLTRTEAQSALQLPHQQSLSTLPAVEDEVDEKLFDHFIRRTSQRLSIAAENESNPWTDLVAPIAKDDEGSMHFLLALSGSHWEKCRTDSTLSERQAFHLDEAVKRLQQRIAKPKAERAAEAEPLITSIILQFTISKIGGTTDLMPQETLASLEVAQESMCPDDTPFWRFARGYCRHYVFSATLTSLPSMAQRLPLHATFDQQFSPGLRGLDDAANGNVGSGSGGPMRQNFHILPGIADVPLMTLMSKVTALRDHVRERQLGGVVPAVSPFMMLQAMALGRYINMWRSGQAAGSARALAAELYRQAASLYLLRTVLSVDKPESLSKFRERVHYGLQWLDLLPSDDPVQSGLLLPSFILGCGAYDADHRARLRRVLDRIEDYGGFGNVAPVRRILERVWAMIDAGDPRSWDWESVVHDMGYDPLVA